MFPKEHGAWNVLGVAGVLGWACLGSWNLSALDATLVWFSGFILRAPIQTWIQYRRVDSEHSRKAMAWAALLFVIATAAGIDFLMRAPSNPKILALGAGIPLGVAILILSVTRRSLRHPLIEALGFAGLCLLTPVLVLTGPGGKIQDVLWLSCLLTAYFILGLGYVKVRQNWLARSRGGEKWDGVKRVRDGKKVLLGYLVLVLAAVLGAPAWGWCLAPGWALLRIGAGIIFGNPALPLMKLGLREMAHSFMFAFLLYSAWPG